MLHTLRKYQIKIKEKIVPDIFVSTGTVILLISTAFLFGFTIWWLNHSPSLQHIWEKFALDKKIPASFCEHLHLSNPVRQPVNTFSNIVYLAIAIVVLKTSWEERFKRNSHDLVTVNTAYSFLFGFLLLYVFFASSFYHASLIDIAHKFDYSAVFAFSFFPIIFFLHRWWLKQNKKLPVSQKRKLTVVFFSIYLLANFLLAFFIPRGKETIAALILILFFFGLAFSATQKEPNNPGRHYMVLSIIFVLVAFLWFEFDKYKILCEPGSYLQPHSLWNLFIGLSAFYFYLYIRIEPYSGTLVVKME